MTMRLLLAALLAGTVFGASAADRFTLIIDNAPESTVNAKGFVVNHKRALIQKELMAQRPSLAELGVKLPPGSKLKAEESARQIAQYHPVWRIYEYKLAMPRDELVRHFEAQGLHFDRSNAKLTFPGSTDFIDGIAENPVHRFRVWRKM
jgi:hypothetical protein